jgi:hypothetical protein
LHLQATLEASIYAFETSYLSNAPDAGSSLPQFGNIVKGYDAYVKAPNTGGHLMNDRKRGRVSGASGGGQPADVREEERLFSRSSGTYERVSDPDDELDDVASDGYYPGTRAQRAGCGIGRLVGQRRSRHTVGYQRHNWRPEEAAALTLVEQPRFGSVFGY